MNIKLKIEKDNTIFFYFKNTYNNFLLLKKEAPLI